MYSKCLLLASLLIVTIAEDTKTSAADSSSLVSQLDSSSSNSNTATTSKVALKDALKVSESNNEYVRNEGHDVNIVITDKGSTLDIRPQEGYSPREDYGTKGGGGGNYHVNQYGRGNDGGHQGADYGNYGPGGGYDQEHQPAYGERVPIDKGNGGYYNADVQQQQPVQQQHSEPHFNPGVSQTGYAVADKQAEHAYGANQVGHSSAGYAGGPAYESYVTDSKDAGGQYQVLPANDQYAQGGYDNTVPAGGYANGNGYGNVAPIEVKQIAPDYGNVAPVEVKQIVPDYGNGGHAVQAQGPAPVPVVDYTHQPQYQNGGDYGNGGQGIQEGYKVPLNNEPKYDYGGFRPIVKQEQYVNNGFDAGHQGHHQGNTFSTAGHTAKVILIPAQEVLPQKNVGNFQYQTSLDHGVKGGAIVKQNDVPDAGHVVDYASGKPYGGNLAQKPYSTDYVSGVKTVVPVKATTYDAEAYVQQKPAYTGPAPGYTVAHQPISADLTNSYANNGYTTSNIIKGPMIGTNYEVNIDALLGMNTIPLNHGSGYASSGSHGGSSSFGGAGFNEGSGLYGSHSTTPLIKSPPTHSAYESSSFHPGGLTSSFNPSLGSGFYAAASAPSFQSSNYGGFRLGSYSTPDVSYAPPVSSAPPQMYGHPVYSGMPKFGTFADYTAAADSLLSGSYDSGFGSYVPKLNFGSSKPSFPSPFRGAYNSVYGYAAASNRIPFVLKAPSSLKNMVKALTGSV